MLMWSLKFLPVSNNEIIADWWEMHQRESEQAMGFVMGTEDKLVIWCGILNLQNISNTIVKFTVKSCNKEWKDNFTLNVKWKLSLTMNEEQFKLKLKRIAIDNKTSKFYFVP